MAAELLKPCPFCGYGKVFAMEDSSNVEDYCSWWVVCPACHAEGPVADRDMLCDSMPAIEDEAEVCSAMVEEKAIELWNRAWVGVE